MTKIGISNNSDVPKQQTKYTRSKTQALYALISSDMRSEDPYRRSLGLKLYLTKIIDPIGKIDHMKFYR